MQSNEWQASFQDLVEDSCFCKSNRLAIQMSKFVDFKVKRYEVPFKENFTSFGIAHHRILDNRNGRGDLRTRQCLRGNASYLQIDFRLIILYYEQSRKAVKSKAPGGGNSSYGARPGNCKGADCSFSFLFF